MPRTNTSAPHQSKYWCFTINNPESPSLSEWVEDEEFRKKHGINTLVYQLEKGKEGTVHFQGYICFDNVKRISALKKLHPLAHWEGRRGTHKQCVDYCTKIDTRVENTNPFIWTNVTQDNEETKSNKFDNLKDLIKNGGKAIDVAEVNFTAFLRYHKGLQLYETSTISARDFKSLVIVIYGPTGTGKSSYIKKAFPTAYWKPKSTWWDEYQQNEVVAIDEFYGWLPYDYMLRLLDRYPLLVECKGGSKQFKSEINCIS